MSPITHALVSWAVGTFVPRSTRRDRVLVTLAGLVPDVDGFGAPIDLFTRAFTESPTRLFHAYHHELHCVGWAVVACGVLAALAERGRRALLGAFCLFAFHLHLLCDVAGAKGPDGSQWEIPYLLPFSRAWQWKVSWQWELNAWPNILLTLLLLGYCVYTALRSGRTVVEVASLRIDRALVRTLRARFGRLVPPRSEESQEAPPSPAEPAPRRPESDS
ncbi:MAG: metal-dependent hydrolase [Planctomycetota bacterium]|nr:MAG: metal-dependent hydrolase [Planctomycetota bacterium]